MELEIKEIVNNNIIIENKGVDVEYIEPTNYEKELLKGTLTPEELIEKEKEELIKKDEINQEDTRRDFITKVKAIALSRCGFHPLSNPSTFDYKSKNEVIKMMEIVLKNTEDEITEEFNNVCIEKIFSKNDYTKYYNK